MEAEEDFAVFMASPDWISADSLPTGSNVGSDADDWGLPVEPLLEVPVANPNHAPLETWCLQVEPSPDLSGLLTWDQTIELAYLDFATGYDMTMPAITPSNSINDMGHTSQPLTDSIAGSSTSPQATYLTPISPQLFPLSPPGMPGQTPAELPAGVDISSLHLEGGFTQLMGEFQQPSPIEHSTGRRILPRPEVVQLPSPTEQDSGRLPHDGAKVFLDPEGYQQPSPIKQSARRRTHRGKGVGGMPMREWRRIDLPAKCELCGKGHDYPASLARHMKTNHQSPGSVYPCQFEGCASIFTRSDHLRRHERGVHRLPPPPKRKKKK